MRKILAFNPGDTTKYPNGNGYIQVGAANEGSKMLLYNESPYNIDIDFLNGNISILHSWEARYWSLDGDTKQVEWIINSSLNVSSPPISLVMGELYDANEKIEGSYPMALIRQTSVGNPGGIQTSGNSVANDGNPTGTQFIEATVSGQSSSSVSLTNDALFKLAVLVAGTLIQCVKTNNTDPLVQLGAAAHLVEILGNLTVDGNEIVNGSFTANGAATFSGAVTATNAGNNISGVAASGLKAGAIPAGVTLPVGQLTGSTTADIQFRDHIGPTGVSLVSVQTNANDTMIRAQSSTGGVHLQSNSGTDLMYVDSTGKINMAGSGPELDLNSSGLIRWRTGNTLQNTSFFTGVGTGTYNHGFGSTPYMVIPITDVSGSQAMGYDTAGSSTVHITCGGGLGFKGMCWS